MEITGAKALVRCLEQEGVEVVFGYPGGAILPVYDELRNSSIKHVLVRQEQGAVHMANGYARATGRVGVVIVTSGPGATNAVTGIANAYMDSVPVVVITGQVPTSQVGTDAFQEVDITGITLPVTKHNYLVKDVEQLSRVLKSAFHIASTGRPGPVLIDLPKDVSTAHLKFDYSGPVQLRGYKPTYQGHPAQIKQAVRLIMEAERPVIYAGGGIVSARASAELLTLAELVNAPVTNTLMGLSGFPGQHPLFLGMLGLHGSRAANLAVTECDLLIALGARFDDRVTGKVAGFAPDARVIHVDVDPAEIGKNVRVNLPIVGDVRQVMRALIEGLKKKDNPVWLQRINELKETHSLTYVRDEDTLQPQYIIQRICELTGGEAIVVTDVGQHQMWAAQYYRCALPGGFITSGGLGTMGYGLPAAIGVKLGAPDKTVVLVVGDGGFQMTMNELGTLVEQGVNLKILLFNNRRLGMVRQLQDFYHDGRKVAVDFSFDLDFTALAGVYGIAAHTVSSDKDLERVLPGALTSGESVLLNCMINPEEDVLPIVLAGSAIDEAVG
ncbi:MAG TPA: biosynthetic-type acetolactate synthase large subunit [Spirochaetia bacterium]|nr:biosynthetic-type acetolactate synthase large subunit [Spirochaetia bacterium]